MINAMEKDKGVRYWELKDWGWCGGEQEYRAVRLCKLPVSYWRIFNAKSIVKYMHLELQGQVQAIWVFWGRIAQYMFRWSEKLELKW